MNDFKYQKKPDTSEEVMNSFKDFNKVLDKHQAISSGYKAAWKWAIAATTSLGIVAGVVFFMDKEESNAEITATASNISEIEVKVSEATSEISTASNTVETIPVVLASNETIIPTKSIETVTPKVDVKPLITTKKEPKEKKFDAPIVINEQNETKVSMDDSIKIAQEQEEKLETWFNLNEKPASERIQLPTLLVSNQGWPRNIDKTELVKSPTFRAVYSGVNREVPIIGGLVYVTESNSKIKPTGYRVKNGTFPPGLIREIHKSGENTILLFKDVKLLIPGRGPVAVGDLQVNVHLDKNYKKKLKLGQPIK